MLTYQCDNGLSLTGPNTITCTNAGVWSTEPEAIKCVSPTEGESIINLRHVGNHRSYGNPLVCLCVYFKYAHLHMAAIAPSFTAWICNYNSLNKL